MRRTLAHVALGALVVMSAVFVAPRAFRDVPGRGEEYRIAGAQLMGPVQILGAEYFHDGGSIMLTLSDTKASRLVAVAHAPIVHGQTHEEITRRMWEEHRIYVGGFPGAPGAVRLERGSSDELELHRVLNDCVAAARITGDALVDPGFGAPAFLARSPGADHHVSGFLARLEQEIQGSESATTRPEARAN
jgi:hypothetical protein